MTTVATDMMTVKPWMNVADAAERVSPHDELSATSALLTPQEVADVLKVPLSWVYEHTRAGCCDPLPVIKIGKYLRFSPDDVLSYVHTLRARSQRRR